MVMRFARDRNESWLHWKERELVSGSYPGPTWARVIRFFITSGRKNVYRLQRLRADRRKRGTYLDRDLKYAAIVRCQCGAGLAYPVGVVFRKHLPHQWDCSAVLKGTYRSDAVHDSYPFAFYDINSEGQPSACGHTTRPGVKSIRHGAMWDRHVR